MKRHDFQNAARLFRAGRLSLNEFTDQVFGSAADTAESLADTLASSVHLPPGSVASAGESSDVSAPPLLAAPNTPRSAATTPSRSSTPLELDPTDLQRAKLSNSATSKSNSTNLKARAATPADGFQPLVSNDVQLAALPHSTHKGDCGRILVIAGSRTMPGAAALAGLAALRAGAGLVTVAVPASIQAIVANFSPCLMTYPLPEQSGQLALEAINDLAPLAESSDVVAIGPGLGRSSAVVQLVVKIYQRWKNKLVVDADALNALAIANLAWQDHAGPRVLTPHPGEFLRICQSWWRNDRQQSPVDGSSLEHREKLESLAVAFAKAHDLTVVLKGSGTVISNGEARWRNTTGNPGMATAGSGDVLTGVIAALWARQNSAAIAAATGCWLQGRSGDLAAAAGSPSSLIATDLLDYLAPAFREITISESSR